MNKDIKTLIRSSLGLPWLVLATTLPVLANDLRIPADYPTIQAAVNAAGPSDTLRIAAGVYREQVSIRSKNLTLIGQPGTILRATEQMVPSVSPFPGVTYVGVHLMIIETSEVTVRGLTFEGESLADYYFGKGPLLGMFFSRSGGILENCNFHGFRGVAHGQEDAVPVWVTPFNEDDVNLRVAGCVFSDNYGAIFLRGSRLRQNVTIAIENNTILGLGPTATVVGYAGIDIRIGVGGRIAGNFISGFSEIGTEPQFPISFGILATDNPNFSDLSPLQIEGNTFQDNQMHISLTKAHGSVIRNNHLLGTAPGIAPVGIAFSGTNVVVSNNQFENMPEGIRLVGDDPLHDELPDLPLGDVLGYALGAKVMDNRFCNVTKPINRQSPATATESGTLLNACPDHVLTIEPAAILSWPRGNEDGTIESASTVNGPWAPTIATPFLQRGQKSIAVPRDNQAQFFRLRR